MPDEIIESDIRSARTLPSKYYTDEVEFQKILSAFDGWQFATHLSDFKENTIIPLDHIELINRESIVLIKDEEVNALSNVCTHRGMRLVLEPCTKKKLHCPYHGRTFHLDGEFIHMPEFEEVTDFPSVDDNLPKYLLKRWNGMYFVSQIEQKALPWKILEDRLGFLKIERFVRDHSRDRDHLVEANWMLYVDNYLEGFHIPYVHPELNQALDYSGYITEIFDGGVLQIGKAVEGDMKFELPPDHPDYGEDIAAYYLWLYPNMMFNFYPWGMSLNIVAPISPSETRIIYRGYVKDATLSEEGAGSILDTVEHQDQWVIELVQRGMNSSTYDRGRYSPTKEQGVHHFHRMISQLLTD